MVSGAGKSMAYHTTGEPDEASGFSLDADNGDAFGIAYANERFYVVDHGDDKVYAYLASGSRDAASDFDLDPYVSLPFGIAYANDRFYVLDVGRDTIWVHGISGQRYPASDFFLLSEDVDEQTVNPTGAITYRNGRLHIASHHNKVYAYRTSGQRDRASDFDLVANIAITAWWGIAYANDRFYVIHNRHNTVYVYDGPTQAGGGDVSETRYAAGDVITTLPTGTWFPDVTMGAVSFANISGSAVISFGNGGNIEEGGYRYTCRSTGGCQVSNREVVSGTIVVISTENSNGNPLPPGGDRTDFVLPIGTAATGIVYANNRLYVLDSQDRVYAYLTSGQRDAASDFALDPEIVLAYGITYANDRFYVLDWDVSVGGTSDKVWVYRTSGQRDPDSDFKLACRKWSADWDHIRQWQALCGRFVWLRVCIPNFWTARFSFRVQRARREWAPGFSWRDRIRQRKVLRSRQRGR